LATAKALPGAPMDEDMPETPFRSNHISTLFDRVLSSKFNAHDSEIRVIPGINR
jgi:hypothetical protein